MQKITKWILLEYILAAPHIDMIRILIICEKRETTLEGDRDIKIKLCSASIVKNKELRL